VGVGVRGWGNVNQHSIYINIYSIINY
jgi:hypothetical protein